MMKKAEVAKKKLILALDVDDLSQARDFVTTLKNLVGLFKIGHQLFTRNGPAAIEMVRDEGGEVFLDLKYHDIPNTVKNAIAAAIDLGVSMLNVHTLGGFTMMAAAAEAVRGKNRPITPILLGVTVLTHLSDNDLNQIGIFSPMAEEVIRLARLAYHAGLNGIVASPQEIFFLRKALPREFVIVTPGVRITKIEGDDQKRILSPAEAIKAGADYLVVGRPVLNSSDPQEATEKILENIASALS